MVVSIIPHLPTDFPAESLPPRVKPVSVVITSPFAQGMPPGLGEAAPRPRFPDLGGLYVRPSCAPRIARLLTPSNCSLTQAR